MYESLRNDLFYSSKYKHNKIYHDDHDDFNYSDFIKIATIYFVAFQYNNIIYFLF